MYNPYSIHNLNCGLYSYTLKMWIIQFEHFTLYNLHFEVYNPHIKVHYRSILYSVEYTRYSVEIEE